MFSIISDKKGKIKEYLLTFSIRDLVFNPIFVDIAFVPVEANDIANDLNECILLLYTTPVKEVVEKNKKLRNPGDFGVLFCNYVCEPGQRAAPMVCWRPNKLILIVESSGYLGFRVVGQKPATNLP